MSEELKQFDRSALRAVVAAAAEEFDADILLLVRDGRKVKMGASEGGGLDARAILAQCLNRLSELEGQPLDATMRAFVRVASEDLGSDQLLLVVRERGDFRLASGAGTQGKIRDMLDDALHSLGGVRRLR